VAVPADGEITALLANQGDNIEEGQNPVILTT